jgi:biotin carboxyl carrier protein
MFSNMVAQLKEADALDRLSDVYAELPRTRRELGYPPLVTPTSQIVGSQAVLNVLFGRYQMISREVKDYVFGLYGQPPAPIDPEVQDLALKGYERGGTPITCRAADLIEPELDKARAATDGLARDIGDVLCFALYPTTGLRFLKWKYEIEPPPEETKALTSPAPAAADAPRRRVFNVRMGADSFVVEVEPEGGSSAIAAASAAAAAVRARGTAQETSVPAWPAPGPAVSAEGIAIVAPMPGLVIRYLVNEGDEVTRGRAIVVLEAMKMENSLASPADGRATRLTRKAGDTVARGDVLAVIGQA